MSITPGPWNLETAPGGVNDGWQISSENTSRGKGRYVVLASRGPITGEEFAGNARLIAAAPEMKGLLYKAHEKLADLNNNYELDCDDSPVNLCFEIRNILHRIDGEGGSNG